MRKSNRPIYISTRICYTVITKKRKIKGRTKGVKMVFKGISKNFLLTDEQQYDTIGAFWDELSEIYGLENLQGLGYCWQGNQISYAIGLKKGDIPNQNVCVELPDEGWISVKGKTENLKAIYDEIYKQGRLQFEIETFSENGDCEILYYRAPNRKG